MRVPSSSTRTRNREAAPHLFGLLPGCRAQLYGESSTCVLTKLMQYTVGLISDSHGVFDKVSLSQCEADPSPFQPAAGSELENPPCHLH
jgi:hypothetical protein